MILGPVSLLDCLAFVIFLIPQLFYQGGIILPLVTVLKLLPFLSEHVPALLKRFQLKSFSSPTTLPIRTRKTVPEARATIAICS